MTSPRREETPRGELVKASQLDLPELPPLFIPCEPERVPHGDSTALRIGRGGYKREFLVLDSGEVVQYRLGETKRWNCSILAFRDSLVLMGAALKRRDLDRTPDAELERQAKVLERQMRKVDPVAWTTGTLWALMVEEMGYGM